MLHIVDFKAFRFGLRKSFCLCTELFFSGRYLKMSPPKRAKLSDDSTNDLLEELTKCRDEVAKDVSDYKFNKNRVRLLAGKEGSYNLCFNFFLYNLVQTYLYDLMIYIFRLSQKRS